MFKVLISDSLSSIAEDVFKKNNINVDVKTDLNPDELQNIIHEYSGLVVRSATKVTNEIITSAKKLKIIGRAGAGVDNIDLNSAKKNNIIVMNTPGGNTNATAEHTLSLLLSLYRNIPLANFSTHQGSWEKKKFKGFELRGKRLGIIGFGNVGSKFAEIAIALGMKVSVYSESFSSRKEKYPKIESKSFEDILKNSDVISFHCKPQKDNKPLITSEHFEIMNKNIVLINTARGGLIDETDLKHALDNNLIKGAALDVFASEPAKKNILFGTKNLILTPHIAASTEEAQVIVAEQIALQISDFFNNNKIINSV